MFVFEAAVDADSKIFDEVVTQKDALIKLIGEKVYSDKCRSALQKGLEKAIEFEVEPMLDKLSSKCEACFGKQESELWSSKAEMQYYKASKDLGKYTSAYKNYAKKGGDDATVLKYIYKDILRNFKTDKVMINDAAIYATKVYEKNPSTESLADVINLLVEVKDYNKAIKLINKEIDKAEKEKSDTSFYKNLLDYVTSKKA